MKNYCFTGKNFTIGWVRFDAANMFLVEEKRLKGVIGNVVDKFYRLDRENLCRFVGFNTVGERAANGSFTGVLRALKEEKIDAYGIPSAMHLYEDFMRFSDALNEESIRTSQIIKNSINDNGDNDDSKASSLHMFEIEIYLKLFVVLAFLLTFLLLFKLVNVSKFSKKAELIGSCLIQVDFRLTKSMNFVSFLVIFYLIYFMIFKSILSNNIKTNSVIVNTSHLVDDQNDLLETRRDICFWYDDFEYKLVSSAPKGYLAKVFEKSKKNANDKACFSYSPTEAFNQIIFSNEITGLAGSSIFSSAIQNAHYYISMKDFFRIVHVVYFKKNVDEVFLDIPRQFLESGIMQKNQEDIKSALKLTFEYRMRIFRSKQEYVNEYSHTSSLNFNYIKDSFKLFLVANLILIVLFVSHHVLKKLTFVYVKFNF